MDTDEIRKAHAVNETIVQAKQMQLLDLQIKTQQYTMKLTSLQLEDHKYEFRLKLCSLFIAVAGLLCAIILAVNSTRNMLGGS